MRLDQVQDEYDGKFAFRFQAWEGVHQQETEFVTSLQAKDRERYRSLHPQPNLPSMSPPSTMSARSMAHQKPARWERAMFVVCSQGELLSMRLCEKAGEEGLVDMLGYIDSATEMTRSKAKGRMLGMAHAVSITLADSFDNRNGNELVPVHLAFESPRDMETALVEVRFSVTASQQRKEASPRSPGVTPSSDPSRFPGTFSGPGEYTPRVTPNANHTISLPRFMQEEMVSEQQPMGTPEEQLSSFLRRCESYGSSAAAPKGPTLRPPTSRSAARGLSVPLATESPNAEVGVLAQGILQLAGDVKAVKADIKKLASTVELIANVHATSGFL
mmetsp:Transcript_8284/g.19346  ORF Transcript_8284/g.19346 Transcript_8284/m.19346 type:complete len:330 (-) Transcript_8284:1545-2534(-)